MKSIPRGGERQDSHDTRVGMRRLINVPIAHTSADMGILGQRLPPPAEGTAFADWWWQDVTRRIKRLRLDWRGAKVYQDGLPDVAEDLVEKIVRQVESPNYELLRWLKGQGAAVLGTESWKLLAEEYESLRAILAAADAGEKKRATESYRVRAPSLLEERDTYITRRIDATLGGGETAVLFVGMAHQVVRRLPRDITVIPLAGLRSVIGNVEFL